MGVRLRSILIVSLFVLGGFAGFLDFGSENVQATNVSGAQYDGFGGPWNPLGNPYIVVGDVTVPTGQTLTIEPGVVVKFDGVYSIYVSGILMAVGTAANRINFTSNKASPSTGDWQQIRVDSPGRIEIKYCDLSYSWSALYLWSTSNNNISHNRMISNGAGVYLDWASNNDIRNNTISNGNGGIHAAVSHNVNITNNRVISNNVNGIYLASSMNANISNNEFFDDGVHIQGSKLIYYNTHVIPDNNLVNGKPLYYHKDCSDEIIDGINVGQLIIVNCADVDINNLRINNTDIGMYFVYSTNVSANNSDILYNNEAITIRYSSGTKITGSYISGNKNAIKIGPLSSNTTVANNNVSDNLLSGIYSGSTNSTIFGNTFYSNDLFGVRLENSAGSIIYNNDIIENSNQAKDDTYNNTWNATYFLGGNYWSDYSPSCVDLFNGPITPQTSGGPDGICDVQYEIDADSIDYYPLKYPVGNQPPFDKPPNIETWEPGGSQSQSYIQGTVLQVVWNASDDKQLPLNSINISYGDHVSGWIAVANDEINDGLYDWDTSSVSCPRTYWINISVFDTKGQTSFDESNYSFDIECPVDNPPALTVWEPGGTPGQMYVQGDIINITWNASDDNALPLNPINITYGQGAAWTLIDNNEMNDGLYQWNTLGVPCPYTYWINISVYDSIGQTTFDESNESFDILCPSDSPPQITVFEPGGTAAQTHIQGDIIQVTWMASDDNTLPIDPINITYGDIGSWTVISTNEVNDGTYNWDTSGLPCPETYWINISVYDSVGQASIDESNYSFELNCPDTTPPIISYLWPPNGSTTSNATTNISANYSDPSGINTTSIRLLIDSIDVTSSSSTLITASGISYIPSSSLTNDIHTVYLAVNDTHGNQATESWSFTVEIPIPSDATSPIISSLQPANQSIISDNTPIIAAHFSDDTGIDIGSVVLILDGIDVTSSASITASDLAYEISIALADGIHTIYLEVKDNSTNQNAANMTWSFTVDTSEGQTPTPPPDQKDFLSEYWWLLVALLAVIIILLLILLMMRKKRKTEETPPKTLVSSEQYQAVLPQPEQHPSQAPQKES
jgi:parallel beta-helix repeat protein